MNEFVRCWDCENSTSAERLIHFPTDTFKKNFNLGSEKALTAHLVPKQAKIDFVSLISPSAVFSETFLMMLATEDVLKKDWDNPIEDEAWSNL